MFQQDTLPVLQRSRAVQRNGCLNQTQHLPLQTVIRSHAQGTGQREARVKIVYQLVMVMVMVLGLVTGAVVHATDEKAAVKEDTFKGLDSEIQDLKKEVVELNRDLFILEEELLFPSSTQVAVFLSVDTGTFFSLDSVQLKLDDKIVSNYLYTGREVSALHQGGVQRIYTGNLKAGDHELVAFFTGKGPNGRDYRRGANLVISKGLGPKFVELKIVDSSGKEQPDFTVKEWE